MAETGSSRPVDPDSSRPMDPGRGRPLDPGSSRHMDPSSSTPMDPGSSRPLDPDISRPVDPDSSRPMDPGRGRPLDPVSSRHMDPSSSRPMDPGSSRPLDPDSSRPLDPDSNRHIDPSSSSSRPMDPGSSRPLDPDSSRHMDPDSSRHMDPNSSRYMDPGTSRPMDPGSSRPTDPDSSRPMDPGRHKGQERSNNQGRQEDPRTRSATLKRPENSSGNNKNPGQMSYRLDNDESVENPPEGTVSKTLKADVDENKIISVTTAISISRPSKMVMMAGKSKTGYTPSGMRKPSFITNKTRPPVSAVDAKPSPKKSSFPAKPGANKSVRKIRFSAQHVAAPSIPSSTSKSKTAAQPEESKSKQKRSPHPGKRSSDKGMPKGGPSDNYSPGILKDKDDKLKKSPRRSKDNKSKKSRRKDKDNKEIKGTPPPTKIPDDGSEQEKRREKKAPKRREKKTVIVQVIFYRFRDMNTVAETFEAEIILNAKWPEPEYNNRKILPDRLLEENEYDWSPDLYFENNVMYPKIIKRSLTLQYEASGTAFIVQSTKYLGKFSESMELRDFPFDIQRLSLLIRTEKPSSEAHLVFSSDEPHIVRKGLYFGEQQFHLYMHVLSEDLSSEPVDEYSGAAKTSDELKVTCHIARKPVFYINNCYLLAIILAILGLWTFAPTAESTMQRNVLSFFGMVASVSHRLTVHPHLPKTPYMTHTGRYCLFVIILLCLLAVWHAVMTIFTDKQRNFLDLPGVILFTGVFILFNIVTWTRILRKNHKDRQMLAKDEVKYLAKLKILREKRASIDDIFTD